ncbi:MAG: hemerythrin domain-containing protein [Bryobacteraceae bacterium]
MRRDPSLIPLSHQHQHALALCVLVDRALASGEDAEAQARVVVDQFDSEMQKHFEVEEQILFPAVMAFASVHDLITELIAEHRRMAALVESLRSSGDRSVILEFSGLLRRHVRKEESVLFEEAQRLLSREQLEAMGEQIAREA